MNKTTAYDELYVNDAQKTVAHSFDYAVNKMNYSLSEYLDQFLSFKYIHLLEKGNPHYVAGMSGIELAKEICNKEGIKYGRLPYEPGLEFWVGWILSYYQWLRNISYKEIIEKFSLERFCKAYPTFHECNKNRMVEYLDEVIFSSNEENQCKK